MRLAGRGLLGEADLNFSFWVILLSDTCLYVWTQEPVHLGTWALPGETAECPCHSLGGVSEVLLLTFIYHLGTNCCGDRSAVGGWLRMVSARSAACRAKWQPGRAYFLESGRRRTSSL